MRSSRTWALLAVGVITLLVLVLTVGNQIYDTNYSALWEATALLAGDHPYRDFYEWGAPLTAILSALAQMIVGYRLIGEFGLQWLCITAGSVLAFHLSLRLSGSMAASIVTGLLALSVLTVTPTYSYPKLLMYPLALSLACWYLDRPSALRVSFLGLVTTIAFLFRHDHGLHVAFAAVLAIALARLARTSTRSVRACGREGAVYGAVGLATIMPWLLMVHLNEGVPEYIRQRTALHEEWSVKESPFRFLTAIGSLRSSPAETSLAAFIPTEANAVMWLQWVTLLVPILVGVSVGIEAIRSWRVRLPLAGAAWCSGLAATVLVVVDDQILRQPSYFAAVAPLTAALASSLLVWRGAATGGAPLRPAVGTAWAAARLALGAGLIITTSLASLQYTQLEGSSLMRKLPPTLRGLLASPPIESVMRAAEAAEFSREMWAEGGDDNERLMLRYLHDCTADGDRVLVTGSTPSDVNYLIERPFAGGHLLWHHGWRADPEHEGRSLSQIRRQSVPFVYSNTDPVLDDFRRYPRIREYLVQHYVELEGSRGLLLVDRRRTPVREFGAVGFPCFR